jgi:hypothetical protein
MSLNRQMLFGQQLPRLLVLGFTLAYVEVLELSPHEGQYLLSLQFDPLVVVGV